VGLLSLAVVSLFSLSGTAAGAPAPATPQTAADPAGSVAPNPVNELDCNGWSKAYGTVRALAGDLCTDPIRVVNGSANRFVDNGWYIGHDEPSVKFLSSTPNSGNTMSYLMKVPVDPSTPPTPSGSVTDYGELSVAPWFGLPICDPRSYPQNPCTPDSDRNSGTISDPNAAGSAFMELQFYPPGFTPFMDNTSCSTTKWCAALTIDSLECTFNFASCNPNCIEPVNFAYLQTNGVPAGPPSPQLTDVTTFTPNAHTLMINPGDALAVSISDPPAGFTTAVQDLTTGQTGYITASAANGFMNTSIGDCSGLPFTFHAEYNTAKIGNQVPWAALEGGVLMEEEIGHSEACTSLANQHAVLQTFPGGQSFSDPNVYDTCVGGSDPTSMGEGPCTNAGICQNATTQGPTGPTACPTDNAATGALCEFADGYCFPGGTRTAIVNGVSTAETSPLDWCNQNRFQNGDLDFDGLDYQASTWPDGTANHPTAMEDIGPFDAKGKTYPKVQFETDANGSANLCNTATGAGCVLPPTDANFYPFYSLSPSTGAAASVAKCVWNFGNLLPTTTQDFGQAAQYGSPDVARYGGTSASKPMPNPQFTGKCGGQP
jgi:hypothetical protein